jgi:hypothetical protein
MSMMPSLVTPAPIAPIKKNEVARESIQQLESTIRQYLLDHALTEPDCPLAHTFAPGAYARTILIPQDTLLVGKIHRHAHLNMLMQGTVSVATEEGPVLLQAPKIMVSKAGTKRVVYAHTEVIWTTVHLTEDTDLEKIEEHIIAKTYDEFDAMQDVDVLQLLPVIRRKEDV